MAYSAREHITKRLQSAGSEIGYDDKVVTDVLDIAHKLIILNPAMPLKDAVNLCFAD